MSIRRWIGGVLLKRLLTRWRARHLDVDSIAWIAAEDCQAGEIIYADLEDDRLKRQPGRNRFAVYIARRDIRAGELVYDDLMAPGRSDLEFFNRHRLG